MTTQKPYIDIVKLLLDDLEDMKRPKPKFVIKIEADISITAVDKNGTKS